MHFVLDSCKTGAYTKANPQHKTLLEGCYDRKDAEVCSS
jgi:hypothetical protein